MTEKRKYSRYSDEEIIAAIEATINFQEAAELLDVNRKTVYAVAKRHGIEATGKNDRRPNHDRVLNKARPRRTPHIMRYVRHWKLMPYLCVECGLGGSWNDKALVLQLDHIDGNPLNNQLVNLRWLCPNCHSQTDTFCGRNVKKVGDAT